MEMVVEETDNNFGFPEAGTWNNTSHIPLENMKMDAPMVSTNCFDNIIIKISLTSSVKKIFIAMAEQIIICILEDCDIPHNLDFFVLI